MVQKKSLILLGTKCLASSVNKTKKKTVNIEGEKPHQILGTIILQF